MMVSNVSSWLKNNKTVQVPQDWLAACINWLNSENQGEALTMQQIQNQVYGQWLDTDLSDLEQPTLPDEILLEKYMLRGKYCLQINSLLDISQSAHSQLLKLQNKDNSNTAVSAETQATQKPWEKKSSRMLMLQLTDGVTNIQAIEYQTIPTLNETLPPGIKVLIKGPVLCREGVIMLSPRHIEVLGGEVEDLFHESCKEATLHKALNLPLPAHNQIHQLPQTENEPETTTNTELVDLGLTEEMLGQLFDDDETETVPNATQRTVTHQNQAVNGSDPIEIIDDVDDEIDEEILLAVDRVEAEMLDSKPNFSSVPPNQPKCHISSYSNSPHTKTEPISVAKINPAPAINPTPPSSKQLTIKDAFNQNFKPLSSHLVSCAQSNKLTVPPPDTKPKTSLNRKRKSSGPESPAKSENKEFSIVSTTTASHQLVDNTTKSIKHVDVKQQISRTDICKNENFSVSCGQPLYMYICRAKKLNQSSVKFRTKAYIVTLLSKLVVNVANQWHLTARICDGTGVLDVEFSDQVLTGLIGFTAAQANQAKNTPGPGESLASLRQGMASCRQEIIGMCKIMSIQIDGQKVEVFDLQDADVKFWQRFDKT
uniref:recQ-mediated genome instability protein 1 n=1 Tax=Ciona intestinalis TaxID=7719 RepID=UPI000180CBC6|nr:recQ-mediated genome instability protein 1 [Ciona intestinalis]|eukprot:XP_002131585.1 recQ-mediated genome instability protein 1 [Ciona intestinalis]